MVLLASGLKLLCMRSKVSQTFYIKTPIKTMKLIEKGRKSMWLK